MTDERKQRQQIMRRIFEGVLPTAEERNTYHISNTDVRALEQFGPIYKEYFRSEIDDLECDFKILMNDLDDEVDDLEYTYKKLEERVDELEYNYDSLKKENENNKKYRAYFKRLMNDVDGEVDDLEDKYKKLEEENEKLKEEIERLETEVHHLS